MRTSDVTINTKNINIKIYVLARRKKLFVVYDSITERFFRAPGPKGKYFIVFVCRSISHNYTHSPHSLKANI